MPNENGRVVKAWVQPTAHSIQISLVDAEGNFTGEVFFCNIHDFDDVRAGRSLKSDGTKYKACPAYLSIRRSKEA